MPLPAIAQRLTILVSLLILLLDNTSIDLIDISSNTDPEFPRFETRPPGGITAWYTMMLTALGNDNEGDFSLDLPTAIRLYEARDESRCIKWRKKFPH